jgi:hypothetical protein
VPLVWAFSPLMGRFFDHSFLSMFNFKESWWVLILLELSSPWCQLFLWKTPSSPCTNCTPFLQTLSFHLLLTINPSTFLSYIGFLFAQTLAIAPHLSSKWAYWDGIWTSIKMFHTKGPILMVFKIIPNCYYYYLSRYP